MTPLQDIKKEIAQPVIHLADADVILTGTEECYSPGCETCDYGSEYGWVYKLSTADGSSSFTVSATQDYFSPISEGDFMLFILGNIDKIEKLTFAEFEDLMSTEWWK